MTPLTPQFDTTKEIIAAVTETKMTPLYHPLSYQHPSNLLAVVPNLHFDTTTKIYSSSLNKMVYVHSHYFILLSLFYRSYNQHDKTDNTNGQIQTPQGHRPDRYSRSTVIFPTQYNVCLQNCQHCKQALSDVELELSPHKA